MTLVCLYNYIVQDLNLLRQVSLDVQALRLGYILYSVLFALELPDLFAGEQDLLLERHDIIFELVDRCLETEWLLCAQHPRGLAHNLSTSHTQATVLGSCESSVASSS